MRPPPLHAYQAFTAVVVASLLLSQSAWLHKVGRGESTPAWVLAKAQRTPDLRA